jgi:hypothetical protein
MVFSNVVGCLPLLCCELMVASGTGIRAACLPGDASPQPGMIALQ